MGKRTYVSTSSGRVEISGQSELPRLSSAPSSPITGQLYFNTTDSSTYVYDGSAWVKIINVNIVDSVSSTSTTTAPASKNIKQAYDLASAAIPKNVIGTINSSATNVAIPYATTPPNFSKIVSTGAASRHKTVFIESSAITLGRPYIAFKGTGTQLLSTGYSGRDRAHILTNRSLFDTHITIGSNQKRRFRAGETVYVPNLNVTVGANLGEIFTTFDQISLGNNQMADKGTTYAWGKDNNDIKWVSARNTSTFGTTQRKTAYSMDLKKWFGVENYTNDVSTIGASFFEHISGTVWAASIDTLGLGSNLYSSQDGRTFKTIATPAIELRAITSNGGSTIVAVGGTSAIFYSTDNGANWASVQPRGNQPETFVSVKYLNGAFYAIGGAIVGAGPMFYTSTNGSTWTAVTKTGINTGASGYDVNYIPSAGAYIVFCNDGTGLIMYRSTNLTSWTQVGSSFNQDTGGSASSVVVNNKIYVTYNGRILTSTDGTTFSEVFLLAPTSSSYTGNQSPTRIQYGDSKIVANSSRHLFVSVDTYNVSAMPVTYQTVT